MVNPNSFHDLCRYHFRVSKIPALWWAYLSLFPFIWTVIGCSSAPARKTMGDFFAPAEFREKIKPVLPQLVKKINELPQPVYIEIDRIRNKTSEHIQTPILSKVLTAELVAAKIPYVDRNLRDLALEEIRKGQAGILADAPQVGELKSPNYILGGELRETVNSTRETRTHNVVFALQLTRLATGEVIWQQNVEFSVKLQDQQYSW